MARDGCTTRRRKKTVVYSYLRFSTPEQALGDSERRQLDIALAWVKRNDLTLDNTLNLTDRGLSGFHGTHRTKGQLGVFLAAVRAGEVPRGSILLVENIDSLSREGASTTLREIIFELWDHEITIQTLAPEESYPPNSGQDVKFLALILYLQRAQEESKRKSDLIRASRNNARKQAREDKKIITKRGPSWLVVENEKFIVIPQAAEAIRLIFDLKLQGLGKTRIARKLNEVSPWMPPQSGSWGESYIQKILKNRAVIGQYQPYALQDGIRKPDGEPIDDYYPKVVDTDIFNAVQELYKANGPRCGGRIVRTSNLFTYINKCGYCGGTMYYNDKGPLPKGGQYLMCKNANLGLGCGCWSNRAIKYADVEETILRNCRGLKPEQVLPNPDEQTKLCNSLKRKLAGRNGELERVEQRIKNYIEQIGDENDRAMRHEFSSRAGELKQQLPIIEKEISEIEEELTKAEHSKKSFSKWQANLNKLCRNLEDLDLRLRLRLRMHLRELIEKIEVFAVGNEKAYDFAGDMPPSRNNKTKIEGGDRVRLSARRAVENWRKQNVDDFAESFGASISEYNPDWQPDKEFHLFAEFITKKRMSKDGRFLRIHFKTGATVDVVPDGSFASGSELVRADNRKKTGWRFVSPDVDKLWAEHKEALKNSTG